MIIQDLLHSSKQSADRKELKKRKGALYLVQNHYM